MRIVCSSISTISEAPWVYNSWSWKLVRAQPCASPCAKDVGFVCIMIRGRYLATVIPCARFAICLCKRLTMPWLMDKGLLTARKSKCSMASTGLLFVNFSDTFLFANVLYACTYCRSYHYGIIIVIAIIIVICIICTCILVMWCPET